MSRSKLLIFGASDLGKTHLSAAVGAGWLKSQSELSLLQRQSSPSSYKEYEKEDELKRLDKFEPLIVDDIGYVKPTDSEGQVLFELITHCYERSSLIITSNKVFSKWDSIFGDNMVTVAAIDRLVHHADIIQIEGESFRKKTSRPR